MIISLEGPDGAGKTTLARQLQAAFPDMDYHHEGPPPIRTRGPHAGPDAMLRYYGALLNRNRGNNIVFDRFALGERVYGPLLRNEHNLPLIAWRELQRLMLASGAVQILCLPPWETCFEAWASKSELITNPESFKASYDAWSQLQGSHDIIWDHTRDSFDRLVRFLKTWSEKPTLPRPWTGSPEASFMLVGDRPSDWRNPVQVPFFGTTGCAPYLFATLDRAGYVDEELALVNAYSHSGQMQRLGARPLPPGVIVIALGRNASKALRQQDITPHHQLPHPWYRKRFFHDQQSEYVEMFRDLRRFL
jgi:hypothetical protein